MADKNVLIYEKDDKFLKALKLYFRGSSYDAVSAASEDEFVSGIRQRRPDILLVAVEVDDGESRALFGKLKPFGLPLIVMSSKRDENDLFSGGLGQTGAQGYIKKPFIKKNILDKLDDVLASAPKGSGGVDLGSMFNDVDQQLDSFLPGGGAGEVSISLDDDTQAEFATVPGGLPAAAPPSSPVTAPNAAPLAFVAPAPAPVHEPAPADIPAEIRRLRDRVRELERDLLGKTEELKKVEREKEQLDRSVGKKEGDLIEKIKSLERSNEELEEDVKKRKSLVAQMTASVQQLNEELEEKDKRNDRVVDDWKAQLAKLQSEYDGLGEKSNNQAHEIEDKADEIARQKRRNEDLEAERTELQSNLEKMTEAKNHGDQDNARLEGDLATERGRIAAGRTNLEKGLAELREKLVAELGTAREALERGLSAARESAEAGAQKTQDETINSLLGK